MKVITIFGRLTKDGEVRQTDTGKFVTFSVAVNEGYGENQTAIFFDVAYNREGIAPYLTKGKQVTVSGYAKKNRYQKTEIDDNGVERAKWINDYQFTVSQFTIPPKDKSEDMLEQEKEKAALPF